MRSDSRCSWHWERRLAQPLRVNQLILPARQVIVLARQVIVRAGQLILPAKQLIVSVPSDSESSDTSSKRRLCQPPTPAQE